MKNIFTFPLLALVLLTLVMGCKEQPLTIPELTVGKRHVLVEELTGVRCQNCPDGTRELISLQNQLGAENLIVVSIHAAGNYSDPYTTVPANQYDFRFPDAQAMADYIGEAEGFPTAAVDRRLIDGNTSLFVFRTTWTGLIADDLAKDYGLGLFLNDDYDPATRQLNIALNIAPEKTLPGENRLTVVITQDSIVDVQQDGAVRKPAYIHRHVLRQIVTAPTGDLISEPLTANGLVRKNYSVILPETFDDKHCTVVAYVHRGGATDKEVLQVEEAAVLK